MEETNLLPLPEPNVRVRPATLADVPFMDWLQKLHTKAVGWMPTKQFEGKVEAGHVLVAEEATGEPVGYCIGNDRYFKRDDVGIIYQMNVVPGRQRGLIGATLLKAQFERSAYGCRLYCCWCAQDLAANKFWESMGFVPLAVRAGSATKGRGRTPRVHIFWQKRIVRGDETTPWWFPSKTDGGAMRADRLAIPIPPGTHWSAAKPLPSLGEETVKRLPAPTRKRTTKQAPPPVKLEAATNGLSFAIPKPTAAPAALAVVESTAVEVPKPKREKAPKPKVDARHIEAARELRDRYLEQVNGGGYRLEGEAKYDVARLPSAGSIFGDGDDAGGARALPETHLLAA